MVVNHSTLLYAKYSNYA